MLVQACYLGGIIKTKALQILCLLSLIFLHSCVQDDETVAAANAYNFTLDYPITHLEIDKIIKEEFAYQGMIGLTVAVIEKGNVIHRKGYGYRDYFGEEPVTTENVFYMNSISKTITAVLAQMLRTELGNEFDWDEKITTYTPEYAANNCDPNTNPWRDDITMRHLLTNTSGTPHYCDFPYAAQIPVYANNGGWQNSMNSDALINFFCQAPMIMAPGSGQYRYSSFGFNLAGCVINDVGFDKMDKGYYELADTWLRTEWGMNNLVPDFGAREGKPLRYELRCTGVIKEEGNTEDRTWALPGSGWLCNPDDLAKFGDNLINDFVDTTDLWGNIGSMPRIRCGGVISGNNPNYGHGFTIYNDSPEIIGHAGGHPMGGAKSKLTINTTNKYVIVGMTNTDWWDWDRVLIQIENSLTASSRNIPKYDYSEVARCDMNDDCENNSTKIFNGLWVSDPGTLRTIRYEISTDLLEREIVDMNDCGFVPIDIDFRSFDNTDSWNAVFEKSNKETSFSLDNSFSPIQYENTVQNYKNQGMEVSDLEVYEKDNQLFWSIITEAIATDRNSKLEMTYEEFVIKNSVNTSQGYLPIDLEIYKLAGQVRYACVWEEKSGSAAFFIGLDDPNDGTLPAEIQSQIATSGMEIIDHEYHGSNSQAFILHTPVSLPSVSGITYDFCDLQLKLEDEVVNDFWLGDLEEKN